MLASLAIICSVLATTPIGIGNTLLEINNDTEYQILANYKVINITASNATSIYSIAIRDNNESTSNIKISSTSNYTHQSCTQYLYLTINKTDETAFVTINITVDNTSILIIRTMQFHSRK